MTANDIRAALRLLERLANPRGDWRDDEARRKARILIKKIRRHVKKIRRHEEKDIDKG